jgi:branched-chain amino acid aminotransferase
MASDPTKWAVEGTDAYGPLRLQRPDWVYFSGAVRPWDDAVLHVSTEAVVRGLNVFEGLKGYWQENGDFGFVLLDRHHSRMRRSASLLHIPFEHAYEEFERACFELTDALQQPDKDFYIRATLFVVEGHYGHGTVSDLVLTGYQQPIEPPAPIDVGVSTWQRSVDLSMPARIKTGSNYQVARLARIEGRSRGFADMLLLNQYGRVAEATGACLLMVREGKVISPPASEGAIESITLEAVAGICLSLGIDLVRRPIDRSELYIADELALTGTLSEITFIRSIDERALPHEAPVLTAIAQRYREAVRGLDPHPSVELAVLRR